MDTITLFFHQAIEYIIHMDFYLNQWIQHMGPWFYVLMFMIIFCETGLIVTPFLPGDSLLFALGALTAIEDAYLNLPLLAVLLFIAAVLGDFVNYSIGRRFGPRIFSSETSRFLNKAHLIRTQEFYEKHGGKTIVIARFVPIIRTFAPFVAGMGQMDYKKFVAYNIGGGAAWILIFLLAGHFFGNLPQVKDHFHIVIFGIIIVSLLPVVFEFVRARRSAA